MQLFDEPNIARYLRDKRMSRRERFWRWLYSLAERRIRRIHMDEWKHDRVCLGCRRWGAIYGWSGERTIDDWHDGLSCSACGHETVWFMGSMLPIPAGSPGTPPPPPG